MGQAAGPTNGDRRSRRLCVYRGRVRPLREEPERHQAAQRSSQLSGTGNAASTVAFVVGLRSVSRTARLHGTAITMPPSAMSTNNEQVVRAGDVRRMSVDACRRECEPLYLGHARTVPFPQAGRG